MRTFTTQAYSLLPDADDQRSNGADLAQVILFNTSNTIQLEATIDDIESFEQETGINLESSDTLEDSLMGQLIEYLNSNRMLLNPV